MKKTRPYRPQTNGKVERFHRTVTDEWAYAKPYPSEDTLRKALPAFWHTYNDHRHRTAIGGPPASRVPNLAGQNTWFTISASDAAPATCPGPCAREPGM